MERLCQESKGRSQKEQTGIKIQFITLKTIAFFTVLSLMLLSIACTQQKTPEQQQLQQQYQQQGQQPTQQPTTETEKEKDTAQPVATTAVNNTEKLKQSITNPQEPDDDLNSDNLDAALKDLDQI